MSTILDQVDNEHKTEGDDIDDYVSTISATNISVISRLQVLKNSPQYLAPEIIDDSCSDSKKAEIWSMGVVLFGMTTGDLPFGAIERRKSGSPVPARSSFYSFGIPSSTEEPASETTKEIMDKIIACKKKPYPDWISKPLKVLLSGILVGNPHKRYSLYDIKASDWMDSVPGDPELNVETENTSTELALPRPVKTTERSYFSFIECICDPYSTFAGSSEIRNGRINGSGMNSRSRDSEPVDQVSYKTDSSSSVCGDTGDRGRLGLSGVGSQSYSSRTQNAVYAAQMRRKYFSSEVGSEKEKQAFRDANYYMKEEAKEELPQSEEEGEEGDREGDEECEGEEERGEAERKGGQEEGVNGALKGANGVFKEGLKSGLNGAGKEVLGSSNGSHSGTGTKSADILGVLVGTVPEHFEDKI
jgi:Protein kinase domain